MRRPDLEARLDALPKVTWRYDPALRVDRIDLPSSKSLQYRLTDVDQDTVDRYAADMTRGDRFPALIVREVRGRLTLIGGNHRRGCKRLTSDGVGYGEHDLSWVTEVSTVDAIDTVAVDALMANGSWRLLHVGSGNGGQTTMTFGWPAAEADRG